MRKPKPIVSEWIIKFRPSGKLDCSKIVEGKTEKAHYREAMEAFFETVTLVMTVHQWRFENGEDHERNPSRRAAQGPSLS